MADLQSLFNRREENDRISFLPQRSAAPQDYAAQQSAANDTMRANLASAGIPDPTSEQQPSALERIFGVLDTPGAGIRSLVYNATNDPTAEDVNPWGEMWKALQGKERVEGADIVENMGVENEWGQMIGGFAVDMLLDPITYLGFGFKAAAKASGKTFIVALKKGEDAATIANRIGKTSQEVDAMVSTLRAAGHLDDAGRIISRGEKSGQFVTDVYKMFGKGGVRFMGVGLGGTDELAKLGFKTKGVFKGSKATQFLQDAFTPEGVRKIQRLAGDAGVPRDEVFDIIARAEWKNSVGIKRAMEAEVQRETAKLVKDMPDPKLRSAVTIGISKQFSDDAWGRLGTAWDDIKRFREGRRSALKDGIARSGIDLKQYEGDEVFEIMLDDILDRWDAAARQFDDTATNLAGAQDEVKGVANWLRQGQGSESKSKVFDAVDESYEGRRTLDDILTIEAPNESAVSVLTDAQKAARDEAQAAVDMLWQGGDEAGTIGVEQIARRTGFDIKQGNEKDVGAFISWLSKEAETGRVAPESAGVVRQYRDALRNLNKFREGYHETGMGISAQAPRRLKELSLEIRQLAARLGPQRKQAKGIESALQRYFQYDSGLQSALERPAQIIDEALDPTALGTYLRQQGFSDEQIEPASRAADLVRERFAKSQATRRKVGLEARDFGPVYLTGMEPMERTAKDERARLEIARSLGFDTDNLRTADRDPLAYLRQGGAKQGAKEYPTPLHRLEGQTLDDLLRFDQAGATDAFGPSRTIADRLGPLDTELDLPALFSAKGTSEAGSIALKELENGLAQAVDPEFARMAATKMSEVFTSDDAMKGFLRTYDKLLNTWKKFATIYRVPAFSSRNLISNKVMMWQEGLLSPHGEQKSLDILTAFQKYSKGADLDPKVQEEVLELMRLGVISTYSELTELVGGKVARGNLPGEKIFAAMNEIVENQSRISAYYTGINKGLGKEAAAEMTNRSLLDYSDEALSHFEKAFMKRLLPFYKWCVPSDSEILTREGFRTYDALRVGEDVLTYNVESDCMEWQPVQEIATFEHDDDLHVFENKRVKLRYTEGHRWVTRRRAQTVKHPYGTYHYGGDRQIKTAGRLTTDDQLMVTAEYHGEASILTPEQARLLGWLVTDGYHRWRGNHLECVLYQSPKKDCFDEVVALAGGTPRSPHPETGVVCIPVLHERVAELKPHFASKDDMPRIVGGLSREAADAMYDAMLKAEGHIARKGTGRQHTAFTQKPGPVLDAFLMLCTMTGRRVSIRPGTDVTTVYVKDRRVLSIAAGKRYTEHYEGTVWCPVTPNSTWVMRQDGIIIITGNTKGNLSKQARLLFEQPGKLTWLGHLKESGDAAVEYDEEAMPDWLRDVFPIVTPLRGEGDSPIMLSTTGVLPIGDLEQLSWLTRLSSNDVQKDFFGSLSPIIREPIEFIFNKDLWYDSPIEEYEGQKKKAPASIDRFGKMAAGVPGLDKVWGLLSSALGIELREDREGEENYYMGAKAVKLSKDLLPWFNNINKVMADTPQTKYDKFMFGTGIKPVLYEEDKFADQKVFELNDILSQATKKARDEGTLERAPQRGSSSSLSDLFGRR